MLWSIYFKNTRQSWFFFSFEKNFFSMGYLSTFLMLVTDSSQIIELITHPSDFVFTPLESLLLIYKAICLPNSIYLPKNSI